MDAPSAKKNPAELGDPIAQTLSDRWFLLRDSATVDQKNEVGIAYISKLLGLGDEVARRFAQGGHGAYHEVGMKQAAVPHDSDVTAFWQEMQNIFPNLHTEGEMRFLVGLCGIEGVFHFLWQIEEPLKEESPVLRALSINAHVYK